jgi:hypothetical protein
MQPRSKATFEGLGVGTGWVVDLLDWQVVAVLSSYYFFHRNRRGNFGVEHLIQSSIAFSCGQTAERLPWFGAPRALKPLKE